jgi:hypothetical protein
MDGIIFSRHLYFKSLFLLDTVARNTALLCYDEHARSNLRSTLKIRNVLCEVFMSKRIGFMVILCCSVLYFPSSWAVWKTVPAGTVSAIGNPSCATVATNQIVCAVRNTVSGLMVNQFNGTTWLTWLNLPGAIRSDASCTGDGAGKVICGATATDGKFLFTIFSAGIWSAPAKINAALFSTPSCARYLPGQVLCAARSVSGGLVYSVYNGVSWSVFVNLATSAVSQPSCTTDNSNRVVCGVFTTTGATLVNRYASGVWSGFINIGGTAGSEPNCVSLNSLGKVVCIAEAYNSGIYGSLFNGMAWAAGNWSVYGAITGTVDENANCTSQASGQLICGVVAVTDSAFWVNSYNGVIWAGWVKIGGVVTGIPSCTPLGAGKVACAVTTLTNKITGFVGP